MKLSLLGLLAVFGSTSAFPAFAEVSSDLNNLPKNQYSRDFSLPSRSIVCGAFAQISAFTKAANAIWTKAKTECAEKDTLIKIVDPVVSCSTYAPNEAFEENFPGCGGQETFACMGRATLICQDSPQ